MLNEVILACTLLIGDPQGRLQMNCGSKVENFEVVRVEAAAGDVQWHLVLSQKKLEELRAKLDRARRDLRPAP